MDAPARPTWVPLEERLAAATERLLAESPEFARPVLAATIPALRRIGQREYYQVMASLDGDGVEAVELLTRELDVVGLADQKAALVDLAEQLNADNAFVRQAARELLRGAITTALSLLLGVLA